jgi:hypothetical protein
VGLGFGLDFGLGLFALEYFAASGFGLGLGLLLGLALGLGLGLFLGLGLGLGLFFGLGLGLIGGGGVFLFINSCCCLISSPNIPGMDPIPAIPPVTSTGAPDPSAAVPLSGFRMMQSVAFSVILLLPSAVTRVNPSLELHGGVTCRIV